MAAAPVEYSTFPGPNEASAHFFPAKFRILPNQSITWPTGIRGGKRMTMMTHILRSHMSVPNCVLLPYDVATWTGFRDCCQLPAFCDITLDKAASWTQVLRRGHGFEKITLLTPFGTNTHTHALDSPEVSPWARGKLTGIGTHYLRGVSQVWP